MYREQIFNACLLRYMYTYSLLVRLAVASLPDVWAWRNTTEEQSCYVIGTRTRFPEDATISNPTMCMERGGCYWAQGSIISPDIGNGGTKNSRRSSRIFFRTFFRGSGEYGGLRYDIAIHGSRRSSRNFFGTTFRFAGGGESEYRYYLEVDCATYSEGQRLRLLPRRRRRSFFGIAARWADWIYSWLDWACAAAGAAESAAIETQKKSQDDTSLLKAVAP